MFETIVALSCANLAVSGGKGGQLDSQTLHHYGQALKLLRRLVEEGQNDTEDAVLFAILALISIEVYFPPVLPMVIPKRSEQVC